MDIQKKTYSALVWSFVDRGGEQLFRFIFSIVLARLLLPSHFGLLGMTYVVTEIARVFVQSGFGLALINKRTATRIDECSIFYFNILIGALLTFIIYIISPAIGHFYKSPELIPLMKLSSLNVVLGSFGIIQSTLMTKEINFKDQTKVSLPATIISGAVGISLAYANFGAWSLIIQTILRTFLYSLFIWLAHSWRPSLLFSFKSLQSMFGFGSRLLMTSLVQMVFGNIYTILIGRLFSTTQLGYYSRAYQTQQLPLDTFWVIIGRVTFPVLSTMKKQPERLINALAKASNNMAFIVIPSLVLGALIAPELFQLFFGAKWAPSVPMFQILCFAGIFSPMESLRSNVIVANGNASLHFRLQLFKYLLIIASIASSYFLGIQKMLFAYGLVSYLVFFVNSYFIEREIGYSLYKQIIDLSPFILCTIPAAACVYIMHFLHIRNLIFSISLQALAGFSVYLFLCYICKLEVMRDNIALIASILHKKARQPAENV